MERLSTKQISTYGLLTILSLSVVFHALILLGIIPFDMVWGGRIKSTSQMLSFEAFSITMNLVMLVAVGIYAGILKVRLHRKILKTVLWFMFALFLLNTLGNTQSTNELEKMLFTPVTLLLALFSLRLALSKAQKPS